MEFNNIEKGAGLLWGLINIVLMVIGNNWTFYDNNWYPHYEFYGHLSQKILSMTKFNPIFAYDLSELLLYGFVPLLVYVAIKYLYLGFKEKKIVNFNFLYC